METQYRCKWTLEQPYLRCLRLYTRRNYITSHYSPQRVAKEDTNLQGILRKHTDVFKGELGIMKDITVKPDSKPKCFKARPVPYAIKPKVEFELNILVESGLLDPVNGLHPLFQS